MQLCNADDLKLSQPSVSRAINFPLDIQQLHRIKANFMAIAGMPGVVGAIDGTHIKIIAPSKDEDVFVNRKKVHSINTQVVFDANFNIAYWMQLFEMQELGVTCWVTVTIHARRGSRHRGSRHPTSIHNRSCMFVCSSIYGRNQ